MVGIEDLRAFYCYYPAFWLCCQVLGSGHLYSPLRMERKAAGRPVELFIQCIRVAIVRGDRSG